VRLKTAQKLDLNFVKALETSRAFFFAPSSQSPEGNFSENSNLTGNLQNAVNILSSK